MLYLRLVEENMYIMYSNREKICKKRVLEYDVKTNTVVIHKNCIVYD